jgi:hypothetical protein
MSLCAVSFITYLWHYVFARTVYDHLVRPLIHGDATGVLLVLLVGAGAFLAGRWTRRRT